MPGGGVSLFTHLDVLLHIQRAPDGECSKELIAAIVNMCRVVGGPASGITREEAIAAATFKDELHTYKCGPCCTNASRSRAVEHSQGSEKGAWSALRVGVACCVWVWQHETGGGSRICMEDVEPLLALRHCQHQRAGEGRNGVAGARN